MAYIEEHVIGIVEEIKMALSDCPRCWNTPCTCGYEYKDWSQAGRINLAAAILGVDGYKLSRAIKIPEEHPLKKEYEASRKANMKDPK